ncbi:helix-turn-helix domain-containing protein [Roseivirga thermotolerans]|uniref:helix-turn-helix domain-containing protein n=1 Tax=Roseivirga thermotolerans TaxID=1758176 RepID=UPI00273E4D90|nr:helix-turn-helix transcriptional regulator [Roseivirga thermotolerans]
MEARKREGRLSQEDLAQFLGTKGPAIGRYERDEMKPSIEVAAKMADYLVGKADIERDKETFDRLKEVSKLSEEDRQYIFRMVDVFIRDAKTKQAYS